MIAAIGKMTNANIWGRWTCVACNAKASVKGQNWTGFQNLPTRGTVYDNQGMRFEFWVLRYSQTRLWSPSMKNKIVLKPVYSLSFVAKCGHRKASNMTISMPKLLRKVFSQAPDDIPQRWRLKRYTRVKQYWFSSRVFHVIPQGATKNILGISVTKKLFKQSIRMPEVAENTKSQEVCRGYTLAEIMEIFIGLCMTSWLSKTKPNLW